MLTRKTVDKIGRIVQFFSNFGLGAIEWDSKTRQFVTTKSKSKLVLWYSAIGFYFLNTIHRTISYFWWTSTETFEERKDYGVHTMYAFSQITMLPSVINMLIRHKDLCCFMNQLIHLDQKLSRKFSLPKGIAVEYIHVFLYKCPQVDTTVLRIHRNQMAMTNILDICSIGRYFTERSSSLILLFTHKVQDTCTTWSSSLG